MIKKTGIWLILLIFVASCNNPQKEEKTGSDIIIPSHDSLYTGIPFIGAQVFIEPGQGVPETDKWFSTLRENHFTVCRIRMFESYMKKSDGSWDFSLFDEAFRSAEKYGISVFATIFPYTEKTDIGGFKFPRDDSHLQSISTFIKELVTHFSRYKCLRGWVLINEPGTGGKIPWTDFTKKKYEEWLARHPGKAFGNDGYPILVDETEQAFLLDLNTWYLEWLAGEIRKYDKVHELHVNNHAIFQNCAEYNFPEWRKFLTSLGGSAHAAWHFGYFMRKQYAVAMSANSEIIRSGAGNIPWFMTELQGGNNTYSGGTPLCPSKEETAQWLWIIFSAEGRGAVFWTLNPRSSGIEAGEWALLDFQDNPSDRMTEAGKVATTLSANSDLFKNCKETDSGIDIIYFRQSLWAESKMAGGSPQNYEARKTGGVMKSALGYFEALSEMGVNVGLKAFEEYDFSKPDYSGNTIILSHQISLPSSCTASLEGFVSKGGKLIVDGLTGFFDENLINRMKTDFPLEKLLGGNISEFRLVDNLFQVRYEDFSLPAHLWRGFILNKTGEVISYFNGMPVGIRNRSGRGEVVWIPSLLGLGSRITGDYSSLQRFLSNEALQSLLRVPVIFAKPMKGWIMKTMVSGVSTITVLINKSAEKGDAELDFKGRKPVSRILYNNMDGKITRGNHVILSPEETMVIEWK